jgi:drug/metabolite transporter (DMT)-like permease
VSLGAGVLLALTSAFVTNLGFLWRHRGARSAPDVRVDHPVRSAIDLFKSKWWAIGFGVAAIAWLLQVAALAIAPLSMVQAALAGGFVFLAVLAERFFGFELGRREWGGLGLTAVAFLFLALTAGQAAGERNSGYALPAMIAFEAGLVALGALFIVSPGANFSGTRRGVLLGAAAGLLFTVTHIAIKALTGQVDGGPGGLISPWTLLLVPSAVVAFFASARSLQIGEAVPVIAVTAIASNASAILAGVVVFGDPVGSDPLIATARIAAFALVVLAAALMPAPVKAAGAEPAGGRRERRAPQSVPA